MPWLLIQLFILKHIIQKGDVCEECRIYVLAWGFCLFNLIKFMPLFLSLFPLSTYSNLLRQWEHVDLSGMRTEWAATRHLSFISYQPPTDTKSKAEHHQLNSHYSLKCILYFNHSTLFCNALSKFQKNILILGKKAGIFAMYYCLYFALVCLLLGSFLMVIQAIAKQLSPFLKGINVTIKQLKSVN